MSALNMLKLKRNNRWGDWDWKGFVRKNRYVRMCENGMEEHFNIPRDVKTMWICLHDRPAADRVKVELLDKDNYLNNDWMVIDGEEIYFLDAPIEYTRAVMKKHGKTVLYAEVHTE